MISDIPNEHRQLLTDCRMAKVMGGSKPKKQEKSRRRRWWRREETISGFKGKLPQADLRISAVVPPDPHPPVSRTLRYMPATLDGFRFCFPRTLAQLNYWRPEIEINGSLVRASVQVMDCSGHWWPASDRVAARLWTRQMAAHRRWRSS